MKLSPLCKVSPEHGQQHEQEQELGTNYKLLDRRRGLLNSRDLG